MNNETSYTALKPYNAVASCNMSQDVISTAKIIVDSISARPVATFRRFTAQDNTNPPVEALVVADPDGAGRRVCHVVKDQSTEAGWNLIPLFGKDVSEVAAGVAYALGSNPGVHGFFIDSSGLSFSRLDGTNWSTPQVIALPKDVAASNLRVTYTPAGAVVLYGQTADGNLITATQKTVGGPFTASVCDMGGALKGGVFSLCMVDEGPWIMAVNIDGAPWLFTGTVGGAEAGSKEQVGFSATLAQIATGYFNVVQATWFFLLVDTDGGIYSCSQKDDTNAVNQIPKAKAKLVSAVGHVSNDEKNSLHLYATDADNMLWVLHQSKNMPWNDNGTPNWVPPIPLGQGVTGVFSDTNPASSPALFALDGELALRLHQQDSATSLWRSGHVHQPASKAFEVVRFRTEINVSDANGLPLANAPVTLSLANNGSAVEIAVRNQLRSVQSDSPVQLTTDASGKLSFSVMANAGMACPDLELNVDGLAKPLSLSPSGAVHTYLSGTGVLNPTNPGGALPVFDADGKTLTAANNGKLAPGAAGNPQLAAVVAQGIQNTAKVGKGETTGMAGYSGDFTNGTFQEIKSPDDLASLLGEHTALTGFWNELENFFGDIWEGIKNAAIAIKNFIVDTATKIAHFAIQIGEWIADGVKLMIKGIEEAAHFIAGIFNAIGAAIEKVIDWLKALFDFAAIWRTKKAFQQALLALPASISDTLKSAEKLGDDWFAKQKGQLDAAFVSMKKRYEGNAMGQLPGWQSPAKGPSSSNLAGNASPADFTSNVHHNWLIEKVSSNPPTGQVTLEGDDPFAGFKDKMAESAQDFQKSIDDLRVAFHAMFTGDGDKVAMVALIDAAQNFVDGILDFVDGLFDGVLEFGEALMTELLRLLNWELPAGFLTTIWGWIADAAGYPDDKKLTVAALISLVAAFPSTVIFKLIAGVDKEPFPDGTFNGGKATNAVMAIEMPWQSVLTSNVLQMVQFVPASTADLLGNNAPGWLTGLSAGQSLLIWVLANGYPTTQQILGGISALSALPPLIKAALDTPYFMKNKDDILDVCTSVYGALKLAYGIYVCAEAPEGEPLGHRIAAVLLPLGPLFNFLCLSGIRDSEAAPFAIAGNYVFDFTAYVGGGLEELLDTLKSQHIIQAA